jgi:hypothetical protein
MQALRRCVRFAAHFSQGRIDWLDIDASHQFADVLKLATASFMVSDLPRIIDRAGQIFGQWNSGERVARQLDQRFPERLQGSHLAF